MRRALRVGVVGLGTAGAAAGVFLARQGHRVHIYEKTTRAALGAAGAAIGLQPIGMTVLAKLGILSPVLEHGRRIDAIKSVTERGVTVLDLRYDDFEPGLFGLGLHRGVLFQELLSAAEAEPNITIECGVDVSSIDTLARGGAAVTEAGGARHSGFDMLVVADGRTSVARTTRAAARERWYPYGCLWAILPDKLGTFTEHPLLQQKLSAGSGREMLGFLPSGRTHDMAADEPGLVSLFWSLKMEDLDKVRERGIDSWKERVFELEPRAEELIREVKSFEDLIPASYSDTWMRRYYDGDTTVFLGDCAHATSPQLGQGSNLALVDAWQLAQSVEACGGDVSAALRHYDAARRWRLRFYQLNSALLTPVFQGDSVVIGALRDALMGPINYFWPTRKQMLTTLVGAARSFVPLSTIPREEYAGFLDGDESAL